MIGAHKVERAVLVDPYNRPVRPDVFADQAVGAEAVVIEILRGPVAIPVMMQRVDGLNRLGLFALSRIYRKFDGTSDELELPAHGFESESCLFIAKIGRILDITCTEFQASFVYCSASYAVFSIEFLKSLLQKYEGPPTYTTNSIASSDKGEIIVSKIFVEGVNRNQNIS